MNKRMLSRFGAAFLVIGLIVAGYIVIDQMGRDRARAAAARPAPAIPVTVATAETKDVPIIVRGIGTVQAYKSVVIKTRVDGQIVKVAFEEGQFVHAGDLLFQIDPQAVPGGARPRRRRQASRRGPARRRPARPRTLRQADRLGLPVAPELRPAAGHRRCADGRPSPSTRPPSRPPRSTSPTPTSARRSTAAPASAWSISATWSRPRRPAPLVNLTQIKPIFVNFTVPQDVTDEVRRNQAIAPAHRAGLCQRRQDPAVGGQAHPDRQPDRHRDRHAPPQGHVREHRRAAVARPVRQCAPGDLDARPPPSPFPQRAVMQGATGYYAYIVKPDNTVERRVVEVAGMQDDIAVVDKGLAAGEKIVVDGQYRLNDGAHIKIDTTPPAAPAPPPRLDAAGRAAELPTPPTAPRQQVGLSGAAMNISETFIRRPIATSLMMLGLLVFGAATYNLLPVAALPNVDFPTITVSATLPGASPETMASSVATPLEQQFAAIPGLASMNSTSGLGTTSITLQFDLNRSHRRRRHRRADGDQRGERASAQGPAQPADLPQGQPGRPRHPDLRRHVRRPADLQGRRLRLHHPGAEDLGGDRRVAGAGGRPAGLRRPRAGQPGGAGLARHRARGRAHGARQRHRRPGQGQPRERPPVGHHRHQRPALPCRRLPQHHRRLQERRAGQAAGRRHGRRRHQVAAHRRLVQRQARRAAADLPPARRQHRRGRRQHQGDDAAPARLGAAVGPCRPDVRPLAVDPQFGGRCRVHPAADHRPGGHGHLHLPAPPVGHHHPLDHRAAVAGRHLRRHVRAGLQHRQPVADGPHHRRRLRGRRRDRHDREHRPLHRGGRKAVRRGAEGRRARSASRSFRSPSR